LKLLLTSELQAEILHTMNIALGLQYVWIALYVPNTVKTIYFIFDLKKQNE